MCDIMFGSYAVGQLCFVKINIIKTDIDKKYAYKFLRRQFTNERTGCKQRKQRS